MELFFEFEKLDVYQLALDYQLVADEIANSLPPGRGVPSDSDPQVRQLDA
jgi:hypothetical protein